MSNRERFFYIILKNTGCENETKRKIKTFYKKIDNFFARTEEEKFRVEKISREIMATVSQYVKAQNDILKQHFQEKHCKVNKKYDYDFIEGCGYIPCPVPAERRGIYPVSYAEKKGRFNR